VEQPQSLMTLEAAAQLTVAEVMLRRPKTLSVDASVAELRRMFEKQSVRTILLVDGEAFVGTVERDDLPADADDAQPVQPYARADAERVSPDARMVDVIPSLERSREGRLVVVDEDGTTLRGMLCMRSGHDAFCIDG
jgi:predicted transcriptional regulator